jgi:LacI family transcriptional regulator
MGVPIVLLNRTAARQSFSTISADNETGGKLAAEYLLKLGHRRIAHLTGPKHHGNMTERARGFLRGLESATSAVEPVVIYGKNNFAGGAEMAQALIREHPEVTAIFVASDTMAYGVMQALIGAGRKIPRDISVIGFDNVELSSIVHPPLTTIHQPKYEIGQAAVEVLLRLTGKTERRAAPEHRLFDVHLVERESCAECAQ